MKLVSYLILVQCMCRALSNFETALFGPTFTDPAQGWRQYANETAFADWFILEELVKNAKHSYHSAAFMYKVCPLLLHQHRVFSCLTAHPRRAAMQVKLHHCVDAWLQL